MRALHIEANAKLRANIFAKNDVLEGVDVGGDGSTEGDGSEGWLRTRVLCCVGAARPGVRSWRRMVQSAACTKTDRFGASRANRRFFCHAPMIEGRSPPPMVVAWERGHGG